MTAALALPLSASHETPNPPVDQAGKMLRQLHLTLLGVQADATEATNIVRSPKAQQDMEKGLKQALKTVQELKQMLGAEIAL